MARSAAAGRRLARHDPELHRSYWTTHDLALADRDLDRATKELIGLALVVAMQCEVCIAFHVRDCLDAGATEGEILDALNVVVMQGGGPAMVHAGYAVEALDEELAARAATVEHAAAEDAAGEDEVVEEPPEREATPDRGDDPDHDPHDDPEIEHQVEQ
ncbi:MAG: carboxymuconolactone decarboxylase family protein [Actinomycetota bacterium]